MVQISAENLIKDYKMGKVIVKAVKNVDLTINKGDFSVLAGPSGSGKTTLLNLLGCMDKPTSGKIYFYGKDVTLLNDIKLAEIRREKMGFIFQDYNLIPVLSAYENIIFSLDLLNKFSKKEKQIKVEKIMEETGILEFKNHRPDELSGGQQQRVAIARALVKDPELVFADEPTANLDSNTGETILEIMKELNKKDKITFIFSSHDKSIIKMADNIIKMHDGEVIN